MSTGSKKLQSASYSRVLPWPCSLLWALLFAPELGSVAPARVGSSWTPGPAGTWLCPVPLGRLIPAINGHHKIGGVVHPHPGEAPRHHFMWVHSTFNSSYRQGTMHPTAPGPSGYHTECTASPKRALSTFQKC